MTHRLRASMLITALALGGLGACGSDDESTVTDETTTTAAEADTGTSAPTTGSDQLTATLTGGAEVPPGDPDGTGTASVSKQATGNAADFCYQVTVKGIDTPTAAHIHKAPAGQAGPPVVTLETPKDDGQGGFSASTCLEVDDALEADIFANPEQYYLNVHTAAHPPGAVRGQLGKQAASG